MPRNSASPPHSRGTFWAPTPPGADLARIGPFFRICGGLPWARLDNPRPSKSRFRGYLWTRAVVTWWCVTMHDDAEARIAVARRHVGGPRRTRRCRGADAPAGLPAVCPRRCHHGLHRRPPLPSGSPTTSPIPSASCSSRKTRHALPVTPFSSPAPETTTLFGGSWSPVPAELSKLYVVADQHGSEPRHC